MTVWTCGGALLLTVLFGLAAWLQVDARERAEKARVNQEMRQNFQQRPDYVGDPSSAMTWRQP